MRLVEFCFSWKGRLTIGLQFIFYISFSQNRYSFDQTIGVQVAGKSIAMPWAGGLNSPQFSTIDLNGDGKNDLVAFDRMNDKIFTYLNIGNQYQYAPDYESYFPTSISEWMLLRDFNCDGKKDLFTSDPAGISVFVNITTRGGPIKWRPFNGGRPLLTIGFNGSINLQMNATDIPAIDDIDEDGDLDVLVGQFAGVGSMQYSRNMSIEKTGRCDSMQLVRMTQEWGNFEECNCGWFAFDRAPCTPPPGGRMSGTKRINRPLHDTGKSLLTLDLTNDGLHDLLFSEQTCSSLYLLPNEGTIANADMNKSSLYPASKPATLLFPAAYFEDVDFDGVKDLVVATNISARVSTDIDMAHSVWFYKNDGTNASPKFDFKKNNWLQDQMIDVGSFASPAFADYDHDGDLDLFISYFAGPDSIASIYQYENIGSANHPAFQLVTSDYLQFSKRGIFNIKIQFIDVDGDGATDLAYTATVKQTGTTQFFYLKNANKESFNFTDQTPTVIPVNFTINQYDNLLLYDVNSDGQLDILWGTSTGALRYYKNIGSLNFVLVNDSYLGLNAGIIRYCVSPTVSDLQHDGKPDLLIANKGSIVVYNNFQSGNPSADTLSISNSLKGTFETKHISTYALITTADLYSNFTPVVVVGTITGGISILKSDGVANNNSSENVISFWPNPINQHERVSIRTSQNSTVQFYTVLGQKLGDSFSVLANETVQVELELSTGIYIARVSWAGKSRAVKLVVQ